MRLTLKISLVVGIFILVASIILVPLVLLSHSEKVADGERIDQTSSISTTSTSRIYPTMLTTTAESTSMPIISSYSSALNSYSQMYCRIQPCQTGNYSYEAIRLIVSISGNYIITSNASVDTVGYLYNETFDPIFPNLNLLLFDDDSAGNSQFKIQYFLDANLKYILIVTTYAKNEMGTFSIRIRGPGIVNLTRTNITSDTQIFQSIYVSRLNSFSLTLCLSPPCTSTYNFYQAFLLNVNASGFYTIVSESTMDTYGLLYNNTFDSMFLSLNLLASDNDNGANNQFSFYWFIHEISRYIVVLTTYDRNVQGEFSVVARGPGSVQFTRV